PPRAVIQRHCRVRIGHSQGIRPGLFRRSGNKPNICNQRGELDPQWTPGSYFPGRAYDLSQKGGVVTELHATSLYIWAGDIEFIGGQPLSVFQDAKDLAVGSNPVSKAGGEHGGLRFSRTMTSA